MLPKEYIHQSVMVSEVLEALKPYSGGKFVDGTIGGAGHSIAILEASSPNGFLYGCDLDPVAVRVAKTRLAAFEGRWEVRENNYDRLEEWVPRGECDGVVLDLGVSSALLEDASRGFSFERDGPLDMRFSPMTKITAADVVNNFSEEDLESIFRNFGDVKEARRIAREIVRVRESDEIKGTLQLARLVQRASGRIKESPVPQVFMSLRIYVNDEFGVIERGLDAALELLKSGGRLAVITFHSGEDRIVKNFGRIKARDYEVIGEVDLPEFRRFRKPILKIISKKPICPSEVEVRNNPRARSAKLRIFERI